MKRNRAVAMLAFLCAVGLVFAAHNDFDRSSENLPAQDENPPATQETADDVMLYNVPLDAELQAHIVSTCEWYHIDPPIVFAVIWKESNFSASAVGDSGDSLGLMQIQEKWHRERMERLGCDDLTDPFQNVTVGIDILANHLYRYEGEPERALMAYNAGVTGANTYWFSKGVYSTEYSRAVMAKAEELRGDMR